MGYKEIDFVAVRCDERIYVQVCRNLLEESDREVANLLEIKDHYPKYVVTLDELAAGNINGVKIVHLADFLLRDACSKKYRWHSYRAKCHLYFSLWDVAFNEQLYLTLALSQTALRCFLLFRTISW